MRTTIAVATVVAGVTVLPLFGLGPEYAGRAAAPQKPSSQPSFATLVKLPSLGSNAEAHGINDAGTVIVGHSFDRAGYLYPVKWTAQNGSWVISKLPFAGSAVARGIDNQGNVVGYGATAPRRPIYWPAAGGYTVLGCDGEIGEAQAISASGQVVVGQGAGSAMAWHPPAPCTETLPALEAGGTAWAFAVTGDGAVIGGRASLASGQRSVPVRWVLTNGQRQIEQLDNRSGTVRGANATGDLAGDVSIPCAQSGGCLRATVWSGAGGSYDLGTLGGSDSWSRDINTAGEVVGVSGGSNGTNTAFFWSPATGMLQLPANRWGGANAVSDVRADGTRLVAGTDSQANAVVWTVRLP